MTAISMGKSLTLVITVALASMVAARTIYVTPAGTGETGADWGSATSLTNALALAQSNDDIWLAGGIYTANTTYTIPAGANLYGGFTNGMAQLAQRDWLAYPVLLNGTGAYRRVASVAAGNARLDGLVITNSGGGGIVKSTSGELILANCRIVGNVTPNSLTGGSGNGRGAHFTGGTIIMTNCVVAGNALSHADTAYNNYGLGVYASGVTLDIVDTLFSNQYCHVWGSRTQKGSALAFINGTLRVLRTSFVNNMVSDNYGGGGGVYLGDGSTLSASFTNCIFLGNWVAHDSRSAAGYGGAVFLELNSSRTVDFVNCTFAGNTNKSANGRGGAIRIASGKMNLRNSIVWGNETTGAGSNGHALSAGASGTLNVYYSLLSGRESPHIVGLVVMTGERVEEPLFASATDLHLQSPAGRWSPTAKAFVTTDTAYSPAIDAGDPDDAIGAEPADYGNNRINLGAYGGTTQASKSPIPVMPEITGRGHILLGHRAKISGEITNDTFVVAETFLCLGTAPVMGETTNGWDLVVNFGEQIFQQPFSTWTGTLQPQTEYFYRWRAVNPGGEGWSEFASFTTGDDVPAGLADVIYVDQRADGACDGTDWYHAFNEIGQAVTAAGGIRTNIWVTSGIYTQKLLLAVSKSVNIIGGFAGTESQPSQRPDAGSGGMSSTYTTVTLAQELFLPCMSITAGNVTLDALRFTGAPDGGALKKSGSGTLTMVNCLADGNHTANINRSGIGCSFTAGTVIMKNCVVANNRSTNYGTSGHGIYSSDVNLQMYSCMVTNNGGRDGWDTRDSAGVGLFFNNGDLEIERSSFIGNHAGVNQDSGGKGGGAIYVGSSKKIAVKIVNTIFNRNECLYRDNNQRPGQGGAIWFNLNALATTATVENCTFAMNTNDTGSASVTGNGGAIAISKGTVVVKNSIFWDNATRHASGGMEISARGGESRLVIDYTSWRFRV